VNQPSKYGDEFDFPRTSASHGDAGAGAHGADDQYGGPARWHPAHLGQPAQQKERLMVEETDMEWTNTADIGVDLILFNTFHGGSDASVGTDSAMCGAVWADQLLR